MGRPSRKGTATTITFNDPDGEMFYFTIDSRGKSNLIGRSPNVNIGYVPINEPGSITPSSSSDNLLGISQCMENSCNKIENMTNAKNEKTEEYDEIVNFEAFLEKINNHFNVDDILRENRLSFLPPISAWKK